jgi:hypothetical protein
MPGGAVHSVFARPEDCMTRLVNARGERTLYYLSIPEIKGMPP